MRIPREGARRRIPDITPLIDCVFLLLIFFMVTSHFIREKNVFKIDLPYGRTPIVRPSRDVTLVTFTSDGVLHVNERKASVAGPDFASALAEAVHATASKVVVIEGDAQAPYGTAVFVMDAIRQLGIEEVSWVVRRDGATRSRRP